MRVDRILVTKFVVVDDYGNRVSQEFTDEADANAFKLDFESQLQNMTNRRKVT